MLIYGTMTSEWDCGAASFTTKATLDSDTGAVESLEMIEGDALEGLSSLDREYFTDKEGKEYEICTNCHEYIMKTSMEDDDVGDGIHQESHCMGGCEE